MKGLKIFSVFFIIGALGYGVIELLWRGHTHPSMLTAGGICFVIFGKISSLLKNTCLLYKAILGSIFVTFIELIFGFLFNVILKKDVWDYSNIPFNFKGQICLLYSVFWWVLGFIFIPFADILNRRLKNTKKVI